jgi:acetolactate synthase-1/2/3 large subunit
MNGAESLVATLVASGVDTCFANPGTSEMQFVAALDKVGGLRAILGLFEGAVTGMADGYGRMAEKPAATLLHLGPGFANGIANLHNARRASTPIVNIVGDHATYHAHYDAPLASDIAGLARTVSAWVQSSPSAKTVATDAARAVQAARTPPGQIATLILPADTAWGEADRPAPPLPVAEPAHVSDRAVDEVAQLLRNGKKSAILLRGTVLKETGLEIAGRIRARTGARLMCDTFAPRLARGAGLVAIERLPYFPEQVVDFLEGVEQLILVGTKPPVAFFAYPDKPSWLTPDGCRISYLAHPHEDGAAALEALAETLRAPDAAADRTALALPDRPSGALNADSAGRAIGLYLPEHAIISDEGATSTLAVAAHTATARPHDILSITGGSIGQGIPVGTGASIASPDRKVVCLQGDGGAMYTLQALWTQAREKLDVTTVIFANRAYAILNIELARMGAAPGPAAHNVLDLGNPALDWIKLAAGMGVEASRATSAEEFADQFASAMKGSGPRLIEAAI